MADGELVGLILSRSSIRTSHFEFASHEQRIKVTRCESEQSIAVRASVVRRRVVVSRIVADSEDMIKACVVHGRERKHHVVVGEVHNMISRSHEVGCHRNPGGRRNLVPRAREAPTSVDRLNLSKQSVLRRK